MVPLGLIVFSIAAPMAPASAQYVYDDGMQLAMRRDDDLSAEQRNELFKARRSWKQSSFNRRVGILQSELNCTIGLQMPMLPRSAGRTKTRPVGSCVPTTWQRSIRFGVASACRPLRCVGSVPNEREHFRPVMATGVADHRRGRRFCGESRWHPTHRRSRLHSHPSRDEERCRGRPRDRAPVQRCAEA